jgi:hypothetical protein
LDPSCDGYWQPQAKDSGISEGIYFQFKDPAFINSIEVVVEGDVEGKANFQTYLDGQTETRQPSIVECTDEEIMKDETDDYCGSTVFYDIKVSPDTKIENGNTVFLIKENGSNDLKYTAKSLFLKIKSADVLPKVKAVRIFGKDESTPVSVNIPATPKAVVTASSVLTPQIAYSPEHLFDSQLDMAWSTNGKETDGTNQKLTISFDKEENIGGIIIWNGYQRSETHYKANGRVKTLDINGQILQIKDEQGLQTISLPKNINAGKLTLTI